jgi:hypothetical protein
MSKTTTQRVAAPTQTNESLLKNFLAGISSGIMNTVLFNPIDKALYCMVKNKNSLFSKGNWTKPYSGVTQAVGNRIISYGMYYPFVDFYKNLLGDTNHFIVGTCTGISTAVLINPINVIKYTNWNNNTSFSIIKSGRQMINSYGYGILMRSVQYTIFRDVTFGVFYTMISPTLNPEKNFIKDVALVSAATVASSPINYFRSQILMAPLNKPIPTAKIIWTEFVADVKTKPNKISYVMGNRFCIGWGTLRVGIGMALSRQQYEYIKKTF